MSQEVPPNLTGNLGAEDRIRSLQDGEMARYWLAAIIESAEDAIISKTLDSIVTYWNAAAERLFGFTSAEMIGQSILRIIPPELQGEEQAKVQMAGD